MAKESTTSGGVGFIGLLTILFVGLKLTGFINWSWRWVLSPILISSILVVAVIAAIILIALIER